MADGVDIDIYADDLDKDFNQTQEEFGGEGVDLYDDVITTTPNDSDVAATTGSGDGANDGDGVSSSDNASATNGNNYSGSSQNNVGRRHQLYVGNLTWWTTDDDMSSAIRDVGVSDFQEVKFFENRTNGQSKGYCVITLGSEPSMRLVMERLPKKELHGQVPIVTFPTKQALNQFESTQKTRPVPTQPSPQQNGPRGPIGPQNMGPGMGPGMPPGMMAPGPPPGHPANRMMNPQMNPGGPPQFRPQQMPHNMQGPPGPPRMQQSPQHGQRFPNQGGQWNRNPRPGAPNGQRPQMFQGPPGPGMPPRGARPGWERPPMHGGFPPQGMPPHMQGPRGPPPPNMGGGPPGQVPAPHVNPAFFNQGGGPPQPGMNMPGGHPPQHFNQPGGPRGPWPGGPGVRPQGPPFQPDQSGQPTMTEHEFEEVMNRNRTVSSSAIARAVSDAAAGEYTSAIETLVTAISLIKQSKVAHDERCKILISSLQDTLHGIEAKSYMRRDRSRSRDRTHRSRPRRERSTSRYRERSRERERDRDRDGKYSSTDRYRERSRSRERGGGNSDHYRDDRSARPRKSPEAPAEAAGETASSSSKRTYYDDRYRSSDRDRDRERDRERDRDRREEHRSRH